MTGAVLAGSTGLVGSNILTTLISHPSLNSIHAYTRRKLPADSPKVTTLEATDSESWPSMFPKAPSPSVFLSALGTTRAQAGGAENQRKIDHDLNLALAKAAKEAGVQTYVLVSSTGASATSMMPYSKMKGDIEDAVKELGFKHCVILRPGLIVGDRDHSRPPEFVLRKIAEFAGAVSGNKLKDFWAQDSDVIAKAAVNAGLHCTEGKREDEGLWILTGADIIRLGRTDWKLPDST